MRSLRHLRAHSSIAVAALLLAALAAVWIAYDDTPAPAGADDKVSKRDLGSQSRSGGSQTLESSSGREAAALPIRSISEETTPNASASTFDPIELERARMTIGYYSVETPGVRDAVEAMSDHEIMRLWRAIQPTHLVRKDVKSELFDAIYKERDALPDSEKMKRVRRWPEVDTNDFLVIRKVKNGKKYVTVIDTRKIKEYDSMTANLQSIDSDLAAMVAEHVRNAGRER